MVGTQYLKNSVFLTVLLFLRKSLASKIGKRFPSFARYAKKRTTIIRHNQIKSLKKWVHCCRRESFIPERAQFDFIKKHCAFSYLLTFTSRRLVAPRTFSILCLVVAAYYRGCAVQSITSIARKPATYGNTWCLFRSGRWHTCLMNVRQKRLKHYSEITAIQHVV